MGDAVHYGEGSEVIELGGKLVNSLKEIRDTTKRGATLLKKMQGSVRDNAYQEAEDIVKEVSTSLLEGLDDAIVVKDKLIKYGEYLDSLG